LAGECFAEACTSIMDTGMAVVISKVAPLGAIKEEWLLCSVGLKDDGSTMKLPVAFAYGTREFILRVRERAMWHPSEWVTS
jgi:hypothetical protein